MEIKPKKARMIALYLPQFHPVEVNNIYWGKGFTEWTNVAKSKPLFRKHLQPRIPADLGFYDLRMEETRLEQAKLAKEAGIEGFCYWHYWFGAGEEVLEGPLDEVVKTKRPDFPFCIGWANHDWTTKSWDKGASKVKETIIFKQKYLGKEDHIIHFYRLLPIFKDKRYITVDGKLLFLIYDPYGFKDVTSFISLWNELAIKEGLSGFHFVALLHSLPSLKLKDMSNIDKLLGTNYSDILDMGFDAINSINQKYAEIKSKGKLNKILFGGVRRIKPGLLLEKHNYKKIIKNLYTRNEMSERIYPQLLVGWDRTPRAGKKAIIYYNNTPDLFYENVKNALKCVKDKSEEHRIIFVNSWNEWGEGAFLEPDLYYGSAYLENLKKALEED